MSKLILILKVGLLFSLIILFSVSLFLPKTNCDECSFELEEKEMGAKQFIQLYFEKCVYPYQNPTMEGINLSGMNVTIVGGIGDEKVYKT